MENLKKIMFHLRILMKGKTIQIQIRHTHHYEEVLFIVVIPIKNALGHEPYTRRLDDEAESKI